MARIYALLQPDGSLLATRQKGSGWAILPGLQGVESRGKNLTVLLSGLDVLGVSATIPARNEREVRRAAPYAIEDELAQSVEASHVALSPPDKANPSAPRDINVIGVARLQELIDDLTERGLADADIMAAHSVLPRQDMLLEGPGLILGRLGGRSFAMDASLGTDVLAGLTDAHPDLVLYGAHIARALGRSPQADGASTPEQLLVQLADWADTGHRGINLRQGRFEARRPVDLQGLGRWKLAGALAAAATIGWFASVLLETNAMNTRANELRNLTGEFARIGWPELNGDVQQALAASGMNSQGNTQPFPSVLNASAVLYDALTQIEGSELRTLRYDRTRRQMTASVAFQSFADLDRLTTLISETGLQARAGDARQSGAKVIGDLTLEATS